MESIKIAVNGNKVCNVPSTLYGIFFEDINHSADGGLNAELVQNNSFEYEYINYNDQNQKVDLRYNKLKFWDISGGGSFCACGDSPICENNSTYLHINCADKMLITNCGYTVSENGEGIPLESGKYKFSAFFRNINFVGAAKIYLLSDGKKSSDELTLLPQDKNFVKLCGELTAKKRCFAKLVIQLDGFGEIDIDYVSLLKSDAYGDSRWTGGKLNNQIVQSLKNLHPSFMRFPGGCIVEGDADKSNRYEWKETIGELQTRKQKANTWGYLQSYAIGFYEYFLLCEDFAMQPLPVLPCGLLCQIRSGSRGEGDVQYALAEKDFKEKVIDSYAHLLYFARGEVSALDSVERYWANIRAQMGHKEPFCMNLLGVGNENWGAIYFSNVKKVLNSLANYDYCGGKIDLAKKFNITFILSVGVDIRPQDTNKSWREILDVYPNCIVDEHVYNCGEWFIDNAYRYDSYDRSQAKIFMGEYAMHTNSDGLGKLGGESTLFAALSEATFLTGVERNCDVVSMTAYAPLLAYTKGYAWTPNLIWFNSRDVMLTPSYHVQAMFAEFTGSELIKSDYEPNVYDGGVFVGGFDTQILLKNIIITRGDSVLYSGNFADNIAYWQNIGELDGKKVDGGYQINCSKMSGLLLNKNFGDCKISVECQVLGGDEGVIVGQNCSNKNNKLSGMFFNYGALGNLVAYEKYRDGYRIAFEALENVSATPKDICNITLELANNKLKGYKNSELILSKNVYNVTQKVFYSVTKNSEHTYIKVVNLNKEVAFIELIGAKNNSAQLIILSGDEKTQNNIQPISGKTENIRPVKKQIKLENQAKIIKVEPISLTVIVL